MVLGLAMVLGLVHLTFCHTSSPQKPASPHFTHSLLTMLFVSFVRPAKRIFNVNDIVPVTGRIATAFSTINLSSDLVSGGNSS